MSDFISNIRIVDILDILIVTAFLFIFINWLRRSASRRLVVAISVFAVIYLLARFFQLYLTELLIKTLIVVILLAAIIVFQSDIRRMIDLAWFWTNFRKKIRLSSYTSTVDILTESTGKMAERRTGALVVIKGKESCERHLTGGIPLEGRISPPLLYSIFNTSSPGHDGAVIIEGNKIARFSAHLPLSVNIEALGEGSTRHAAGLGLSEHCDAFIIIVSEERGTISIAENATLTILKSTVELKNRLEKFYQKNYPAVKESEARWWNKRNILTAVSSLLIAVVAWLLLAYHSDRIFRNYTVPIEFRNITSDFTLARQVPSKAEVTLEGSEQDFRLLDASELVVSLNLDDLKKGRNEFNITGENIELPSGIKLYDIEPKKIIVNAIPTKTIPLPVSVPTTGKLPKGMKLVSIEVNPATVMVITPAEGDHIPKSIKTETVDLSDINSTTSLNIELIIPEKLKLPPEEDNNVSVTVNIKKR
jgi:diadenylate cyclase